MLQTQVHQSEPVPSPGVWLRMGGLPGWWGHPGSSTSGLFLGGGSGAINTAPPLFLLRWTVTTAPSSAPMDDCACAQPRPLPLKTLPRFPPPSQGRSPPPSCSPNTTCCSHRFFCFSPPSYDGTGPCPAATAAALCVAAAVVVLAAAAFSRKWISRGVRIHPPPGDPADV